MDDPKHMQRLSARPLMMIDSNPSGDGARLARAYMLQQKAAMLDFAEMEKKLLGMGAEIVGDEYVLTQFNAEAKKLLETFDQRLDMLKTVGYSVGVTYADVLGEPRGNRRARRRARAQNR